MEYFKLNQDKKLVFKLCKVSMAYYRSTRASNQISDQNQIVLFSDLVSYNFHRKTASAQNYAKYIRK